jgi:hypothetical protein
MVVPCLSAAWGMPIVGLNVEFRGCLFFVWTAPDMDISECDKNHSLIFDQVTHPAGAGVFTYRVDNFRRKRLVDIFSQNSMS